MLAPRADQPLLDAAEYALPSLRALYLTATEAATYEDARRYAERYRLEAERLNEIETKSRAQGKALPDELGAPHVVVPANPTARCGAARNSSCARCARAPASGCAGSPGPAMLVLGIADRAGRGRRGTAQDPEQGVTRVTSM